MGVDEAYGEGLRGWCSFFCLVCLVIYCCRGYFWDLLLGFTFASL